MKPYQFKDGVAIDLEKIVAIEEIKFINASLNKRSDWMTGEYYYSIILQWSEKKLKRYSNGYSDSDKAKLEEERNMLIKLWTN